MKPTRHSVKITIFALALIPLIVTSMAACARQDQPIAVGDRATPTPTPTEAERARAAAAATATPTPVTLPTSVPVVVPTASPTQVPTLVPTEQPTPTTEPTPNTLPALQPPKTPSQQDTPTPMPSSTPTPDPTATPSPEPPPTAPSILPTNTAVPIPTDYNRRTEGPPRDELIKFAQWKENRVKLGNWVAGYIVAHGLDHPVRIIEMNPEDYKDSLPHSDVDVVMEADPVWAKPYVDAGVLVLLGPLSNASPDTVVAVNASVWRRAPNVGRFLERYEWNGEQLATESAKIQSGRIGIRENIVGLSFFKDNQPIWSQWVESEVVANVQRAIEEGKVNHCRRFEERRAGTVSRVCVDDPTKSITDGAYRYRPQGDSNGFRTEVGHRTDDARDAAAHLPPMTRH